MELLVASVITLFVFSSVIYTYIMIQRFWRGGNTQIALRRDARIATEKITRQIRSGLEAQVFNGGDTLRLRLDPNRTETQTDDIWCEYDFTQNKIIFIPDLGTPNTTVVILNNACRDNNRAIFTLNGKNIGVVLGTKDDTGTTGYRSGYEESSATLRNG